MDQRKIPPRLVHEWLVGAKVRRVKLKAAVGGKRAARTSMSDDRRAAGRAPNRWRTRCLRGRHQLKRAAADGGLHAHPVVKTKLERVGGAVGEDASADRPAKIGDGRRRERAVCEREGGEAAVARLALRVISHDEHIGTRTPDGDAMAA